MCTSNTESGLTVLVNLWMTTDYADGLTFVVYTTNMLESYLTSGFHALDHFVPAAFTIPSSRSYCIFKLIFPIGYYLHGLWWHKSFKRLSIDELNSKLQAHHAVQMSTYYHDKYFLGKIFSNLVKNCTVQMETFHFGMMYGVVCSLFSSHHYNYLYHIIGI